MKKLVRRKPPKKGNSKSRLRNILPLTNGLIVTIVLHLFAGCGSSIKQGRFKNETAPNLNGVELAELKLDLSIAGLKNIDNVKRIQTLVTDKKFPKDQTADLRASINLLLESPEVQGDKKLVSALENLAASLLLYGDLSELKTDYDHSDTGKGVSGREIELKLVRIPTKVKEAKIIETIVVVNSNPELSATTAPYFTSQDDAKDFIDAYGYATSAPADSPGKYDDQITPAQLDAIKRVVEARSDRWADRVGDAWPEIQKLLTSGDPAKVAEGLRQLKEKVGDTTLGQNIQSAIEEGLEEVEKITTLTGKTKFIFETGVAIEVPGRVIGLKDAAIIIGYVYRYYILEGKRDGAIIDVPGHEHEAILGGRYTVTKGAKKLVSFTIGAKAGKLEIKDVDINEASVELWGDVKVWITATTSLSAGVSGYVLGPRKGLLRPSLTFEKKFLVEGWKPSFLLGADITLDTDESLVPEEFRRTVQDWSVSAGVAFDPYLDWLRFNAQFVGGQRFGSIDDPDKALFVVGARGGVTFTINIGEQIFILDAGVAGGKNLPVLTNANLTYTF